MPFSRHLYIYMQRQNKVQAKFKQDQRTSYFRRRKVDVVFMIDGTEKMTNFIDTLGTIFSQIIQHTSRYHSNFDFNYGAVVYRDFIVTLKQERETEKYIWIDLTENPSRIQSMFHVMRKTDGGGDGAEDWASGYQCLLDRIHWNEDATKIVIHVSTSPGHGNTFTGKKDLISQYITIPSFAENNTDEMNRKIYNDIQYKQDGYFRKLINEVAEKKISFFCINGDENSMQCFKRTQCLYNSNGNGLKFIIKNEFGYIFKQNSSNNDIDFDKFQKKLLNNIQSGIDVIISSSLKDSLSEYERETNEEFSKQLNDFEWQHYEKKKDKITIELGKYILNELNKFKDMDQNSIEDKNEVSINEEESESEIDEEESESEEDNDIKDESENEEDNDKKDESVNEEDNDIKDEKDNDKKDESESDDEEESENDYYIDDDEDENNDENYLDDEY